MNAVDRFSAYHRYEWPAYTTMIDLFSPTVTIRRDIWCPCWQGRVMTWKSARVVGMVTSFFGFYEWARLAVFDKWAVCIHLVQIKWQLIPFS
jgi:hypothetical protein